MSLRLQFLLIVAAPFALIIYFGWTAISSGLDLVRDSERQSATVQEILTLSNLTHQLQRERGFSSGFLASGGKNLAADLTAQRIQTDLAAAEAQAALPQIEGLVPAGLSHLRQSLAKLTAMRGKVTALQVDVPTMAKFYTGAIETEIAIEHHAAAANQADPLLSDAIVDLTRAKEYAGLDRATGVAAIGLGTADAGFHARLIALSAAEQAQLRDLDMKVKTQGYVEALLATAEFTALAKMRDDLLALLSQGKPVSFAARDWFVAASAWIEVLEAQKQDLLNRSLSQTRAATTAARQAIQLNILGILAASACSFLMATGVGALMIRKIKTMITLMGAFAGGNLEAFVPNTKGRSELHKMAAALYILKQELRAARRTNEDAANILQRARASQNRVVDLVTEGLSALASSNLTLQFQEALDEDHDGIRVDFNTATERLRDALTDIILAVQDIDQGAMQMRVSASQLAERNDLQNETLQSTAAAVEELSATVAESSQDLKAARQIVEQSRSSASASSHVVSDAISTMDRISEGSKRIGQIISLIDDIAFQTNLLALNAGVEAARAGDSGRGFAVVAAEVRELAARSSNAAKEIKLLIDSSSRQVDDGVRLVGRAGAALKQIFDQIVDVDEIVSKVATSAQEQSDALTKVNSSMITMDKVRQKNNEMVTQTRTVSDSLAERAKELSQTVSTFDIGQRNPTSGRIAA